MLKNFKINEGQINDIIRESVFSVLNFMVLKEAMKKDNDIIKIEDFFDIDKLTKKNILSIANDLSAFIPGQGFGSNITEGGDLILNESEGKTSSVKELRTELKKFGFKQWQIKSQIFFNKVRVVILYADLSKNTSILKNEMLSLGWSVAHISEPKIIHGIPVRVMDFDPLEQTALNKEVHKSQFLFHWTPSENVASILEKGLEPRSQNDFLTYPPKVHLIKETISLSDICKLGWLLYNKNCTKKDGNYTLLKINVEKIPNNINFFGDPRFQFGYFTKEVIPPIAISVFGKINYLDKKQYNNETLTTTK